jgi:hypothetical protein
MTGNAESNVDLSTTGNSNAYGVAPDAEWPTADFNLNITFGGLSLAQLLALLGH